jgi:hypothetical protein
MRWRKGELILGDGEGKRQKTKNKKKKKKRKQNEDRIDSQRALGL